MVGEIALIGIEVDRKKKMNIQSKKKVGEPKYNFVLKSLEDGLGWLGFF